MSVPGLIMNRETRLCIGYQQAIRLLITLRLVKSISQVQEIGYLREQILPCGRNPESLFYGSTEYVRFLPIWSQTYFRSQLTIANLAGCGKTILKHALRCQ